MSRTMLLMLLSVAMPAYAGSGEPGSVPEAKVDAANPVAASREQLAAQLFRKWEPFILETGTPQLSEWRGEIEALIEKADLRNLQLAIDRDVYAAMLSTLKGTPIGDEHALEQVAERAEQLDLSGAQMKALGDIDRDLIYVPVPDCRIADTRQAGGIISANTVRNFDVSSVSNYSAQGGDSTNCGGVGAAGSFAAAMFRFTVITPAASGYMTAYPFGATQPLVSTVNYQAGEIVQTMASTRLDQGASSNELSVYSFAQTHLVIDIVGYFHNPEPLVFECVDSGDTATVVAPGATANSVAPSCPSGYVTTSTNCESSTWQMPFVYFAGGICSAQNNSAGNAQIRSSRTCCRARFQ